MRARVRIAAGELPQAADWARHRGVSVTDDVGFPSEFDHLTLVRLLVAQHRARPVPGVLEQALGLLDRLDGAADASGRAGSLLEIRMLQALVLDALGRRPEALRVLRRARAEAPEPDAYLRLYLDEGEPMVALLRDAAEEDPQPPAGASPAASVAAASVAASAAGPLSDRELQVLRLLAGELTGPQIARELFVSHNTLRTHTKHIFAKLDVTSRMAAVRRAREVGLL
jgi:LuxR family maltose regulon positive regulatory protein